jgi:hypothetical protein
VAKQSDKLDSKREKYFNEIMRNSTQKLRNSRGVNVEERLLAEGDKYQKRLEQLKHEKEIKINSVQMYVIHFSVI